MVSIVFLLAVIPMIFGNPFEDTVDGPPIDDIIYTPELRNQLKQRGVKVNTKYWPNGVVPYIFDPNLNAKARSAFAEAAATYGKLTCIRFATKTAADKNFIRIYEGPARNCLSDVGIVGGQQNLSIGAGCEVASVFVHELMHALGFFHEHQRPDRDQYLYYYKANVIPGLEWIMEPHKTNQEDLQNIKYDYLSIMHYTRTASSLNGKDTLVPRDPKYLNEIGNQKEFSKCDLEKINKLYKCSQYIKNDPSCLMTTGR